MKILQYSRSLIFAAATLLVGVSHLTAQTATAVSSDKLSFASQVGGLAANPQTVEVYSAPSNVTFTALAQQSSGTGVWLLVNGSTQVSGITGTASHFINISVNPAGLPVGNYTGTVTINAPSAAPNVINVSLKVSASPQIILNPGSLSIAGQTGVISTANVVVGSSGNQLPFTVTATPLGPLTSWLSVSPVAGTTGTQVSVTANANALPAGTTIAVGYLTFTSTGADGGSVTLPIAVTVAAAPSLFVNPTTVLFGFQVGAAVPSSKPITITSSNGTVYPYTAQVTSGSWLSLSSVPTTTPAPQPQTQ
ncbi:MAG: hypothetical protein WKF37_08445 [Bryobacteraceae bacterium]